MKFGTGVQHCIYFDAKVVAVAVEGGLRSFPTLYKVSCHTFIPTLWYNYLFIGVTDGW